MLFGGEKKTGLSPKTVSCILSVLKNAFEYAIQFQKLNVITINNFSVKRPPKLLKIFSIQEQRKLSNYLCENLTLTNLGILLCLYTGIRIGEVCALKWKDIILKENSLYVCKTMQRIQNKELNMKDRNKTSILISAPKSNCSFRVIPLPKEILKLLIKNQCPGSTFFLTGKTDTYIEPKTLQNRFKAIPKACNIREANFHTLRRTFATRCIEWGFDVNVQVKYSDMPVAPTRKTGGSGRGL